MARIQDDEEENGVINWSNVFARLVAAKLLNSDQAQAIKHLAHVRLAKLLQLLKTDLLPVEVSDYCLKKTGNLLEVFNS